MTREECLSEICDETTASHKPIDLESMNMKSAEFRSHHDSVQIGLQARVQGGMALKLALPGCAASSGNAMPPRCLS